MIRKVGPVARYFLVFVVGVAFVHAVPSPAWFFQAEKYIGQEWAMRNTILILIAILGGAIWMTVIYYDARKWTGPSQAHEIREMRGELGVQTVNISRLDGDVNDLKSLFFNEAERMQAQIHALQRFVHENHSDLRDRVQILERRVDEIEAKPTP